MQVGPLMMGWELPLPLAWGPNPRQRRRLRRPVSRRGPSGRRPPAQKRQKRLLALPLGHGPGLRPPLVLPFRRAGAVCDAPAVRWEELDEAGDGFLNSFGSRVCPKVVLPCLDGVRRAWGCELQELLVNASKPMRVGEGAGCLLLLGRSARCSLVLGLLTRLGRWCLGGTEPVLVPGMSEADGTAGRLASARQWPPLTPFRPFRVSLYGLSAEALHQPWLSVFQKVGNVH